MQRKYLYLLNSRIS